MTTYLLTYKDGNLEQVRGILVTTETHYDFYNEGLLLSVARADIVRIQKGPES